MERSPVTVAIGSFDDLLARGLRALVEEQDSLALVASPRDDIGDVLRLRRPRVAILDRASLDSPIQMRALAREHEGTSFVLLADGISSAESAQLLAFGASACLSRSTQARDVLSAIHMAARGMQLTPRDFERSGPDTAVLTEREAEVLAELQRRRANAQIASDLHISVETVRTHARSIYRKLGVSSRRELIAPPESVTATQSAD